MQNTWINDYQQQFIRAISTHKWIVAIDVLIAAGALGRMLRKQGATEVFLLAGTRGTGEVDASFPYIDLDITAVTGLMEGIYAIENAFQNLSQEHVAILDRFDPNKEAKVMVSLFASPLPIGGRKVFGARETSWVNLENKLIIDALWDTVGIARMPSENLSLHTADFWLHCQKYDRGHGVVVAGDNRDGWHGGASRIRHIQNAKDAKLTQSFLEKHCDEVRVMPFLEGIPCSIHGWVFPEKVVSIRPCEMLVLQNKDDGSFIYCGVGTSWKPPISIDEEMQSTAVLVGQYLQKEYGYRGCFTIDGVATKDGFFPTELNPRFGGAVGRMQHSVPDLPLYLLHLCLVEGIPLQHYPTEFAHFLRDQVDQTPYVQGMYVLQGRYDIPSQNLWMSRHANQWVVVADACANACTVKIGPNPSGTLILVEIHSSYIGYGESGASIFLEALQALAKWMAVDLPSLEASVDVERKK